MHPTKTILALCVAFAAATTATPKPTQVEEQDALLANPADANPTACMSVRARVRMYLDNQQDLEQALCAQSHVEEQNTILTNPADACTSHSTPTAYMTESMRTRVKESLDDKQDLEQAFQAFREQARREQSLYEQAVRERAKSHDALLAVPADESTPHSTPPAYMTESMRTRVKMSLDNKQDFEQTLRERAKSHENLFDQALAEHFVEMFEAFRILPKDREERACRIAYLKMIRSSYDENVKAGYQAAQGQTTDVEEAGGEREDKDEVKREL